jgi:hypothetical protein
VVSRSPWQGLQQWIQTYILGAEATGLTDEELKSQAIQNDTHTQNLIAIEKARGAMKIKLAAVLGGLGLAALMVVVGAVLLVVQAAGGLKLPWSRIGTGALTFLGTSGLSGLVWAAIRAWRRGRAADPTPANRSAHRAEDGQNQVGTT